MAGVAMTTDQTGGDMLNVCPPGYHRHLMTCARCSVTDQTVAVTTTRDGNTWPPTCQACARVIRMKSDQALRKQQQESAR